MSSELELEMPLSYNKITHFNLEVDYTKNLLKKLKKRSVLRKAKVCSFYKENEINELELEMPLSYNKITHFNLEVDYTKKLLKKLKSRKIPKIVPVKNTNSKNEFGEWKNDKGELHRENDLPAIIRCDGTKQWWINGKLHRENDKPAIIRANGVKEWWFNGKPFRKGKKPIIEHPNDHFIYEILNSLKK
jgi:hypothetical protein